MPNFFKSWFSDNVRRFFWLAVVLLIAVIYGIYRHSTNADLGQTVFTAQRAGLWDVELTDLEGEQRTLAPYEGKTLVLNFWGSWCEPCLQEIPHFVAAQNKYKSKQVQFIGIAVDSAENVIEFMRIFNVNYPIYLAGFDGAQLARDFGNVQGGLPFTVMIDTEGNVRSTILGKVSAERLDSELSALTTELSADPV